MLTKIFYTFLFFISLFNFFYTKFSTKKIKREQVVKDALEMYSKFSFANLATYLSAIQKVPYI